MFTLEFDLWEEGDRCFVLEYLENDCDSALAEKIKDKLEDYERIDFGTLMRDEKLKKLEKGIHEVRIRINRTNVRLLGTIRGRTMCLVLCFIKTTNNTPIVKLRTARERIKRI